jgi:hypothetical protein
MQCVILITNLSESVRRHFFFKYHQRLFLLEKMLYCVIIVCITVLLDPYGCKMQLNKIYS